MARKARVVVPGVALHAMQRGNNRSACFVGDSDRLVYLVTAKELAAEHGCTVHAYCLMTNHVHLLFTPSEESACGTFMRRLSQRYVQYFNRRYERTGTLWEGRFRSCLVESASYVLACYRYIELNPVRAGMVERPDAYPWSSFHANARGRSDPLVVPHPEYSALGEGEAARRAAYDTMLRDEIDPLLLENIRTATRGGFPLASEPFKDALKRARGDANYNRP